MYDSTNPDIVTSIGPSEEKSVVLTFDDGPSKLLPRFLDVLQQHGVPAVFFWETRLLHPDRPWKRVLEEGHQLGTHATKHVNLTKLTHEQQYNELKNSQQRIETITGATVKLFRPPFGQFNDDTLQAAKRLGMTTVMWKVAPIDWELKESPEQIVANTVSHLEDGAIILLHEIRPTLGILPQLIEAIREKGYTFKLL
ncbi:polysaccharide deacetylase family protein [Planococcus salinus]|uniref:Polysaccharide deacetylase family protein n=1 Tax=Planococcus salinus TaxID=1848460 RepID=A0A3M8P8B6_9BACL|nr:polysaccharide deacetylase family protein [Planococcus salinus]RNF39862.1 polysaccharide deacetylase family protein [Planococcus salinus]